MTTTTQNNSSEAACEAAIAYDEPDKLTQLRNILKTAPECDQERFRPAMEQAAQVLELFSPAVMAMTKDGLFTGLVSSLDPSAIAMIAASADRVVITAVPIAELDAHVEGACGLFEEANKRTPCTTDAERIELCGALVVKVFRDEGSKVGNRLPKPVLHRAFMEAMAWRSKGCFDLVRGAAKGGVASAFVTLVSDTKKDAFRNVTICYARHCPPELMAFASPSPLFALVPRTTDNV